MRQLVIAHSGEPLDWITHITAPWTIHVVRNGIHRPNEGREAGAYLHWILQHYHRIQPHDHITFTQANPFPHCPDILDRLNNHHPDTGPYTPLTNLYVSCDGNGAPHHPGLPLAAAYQGLVGKPWPGQLKFHANGQFIVTGWMLTLYPPHFYQRLADRLRGVDPPFGYVLERLWGELFSQ